ncbi:MAG TPA: hypothetical protein VML96_09675 [Egibacteraceae bacterium]|nr:hypothetical protein [Egibacteraceae bacterium]
MVAFLSAYGLMVAGAAPVLQALLNLLGCGTAARYLARKRAIPNVICNIIWAVITLIGLIPGGSASVRAVAHTARETMPRRRRSCRHAWPLIDRGMVHPR